MNKRIPTFEEYQQSNVDKQSLKESNMSEIDIVRQESADAKDFVKRMKKDMPEVAKKFSDKELENFYQELMDAADESEQVDEASSKNPWVILRRDNPQLTKPYYMVRGQMSKKEIKDAENPAYGYITAETYATKEEQDEAIAKYKADGFRVS